MFDSISKLIMKHLSKITKKIDDSKLNFSSDTKLSMIWIEHILDTLINVYVSN